MIPYIIQRKTIAAIPDTVVLIADRSAVAPADAAFTRRALVNAPDVTDPVRMDRSSSTDLTVSYETE